MIDKMIAFADLISKNPEVRALLEQYAAAVAKMVEAQTELREIETKLQPFAVALAASGVSLRGAKKSGRPQTSRPHSIAGRIRRVLAERQSATPGELTTDERLQGIEARTIAKHLSALKTRGVVRRLEGNRFEMVDKS